MSLLRTKRKVPPCSCHGIFKRVSVSSIFVEEEPLPIGVFEAKDKGVAWSKLEDLPKL